MSEEGAVGVFDSGIGGLTVLKELLARLPGESFVYFGDTARVPYGTKSAETVLRFSRENVDVSSRPVGQVHRGRVQHRFRRRGPAAAEGVPHPDTRRDRAGRARGGRRVQIEADRRDRDRGNDPLGSVPAGDQDARSARRRSTRGRVRSSSRFVEEGWVDKEVTQMVANDVPRRISRTKNIDTLVLGCTHYPLLRGVIGRAVGEGVTLVDSAVQTAIEVGRRPRRARASERRRRGGFHRVPERLRPGFQAGGRDGFSVGRSPRSVFARCRRV